MSAGGSTSSSDTSFTRKGNVKTDSWRQLTDGGSNRFGQAFGAVTPQGDNAAVPGELLGRITGSKELPYLNHMGSIINANAPSQPLYGQYSLHKQASIDPYNGSYETNTHNRYADEVRRAMASARSGPMATRGGTAAQGFAMSDVINQMGLNREDVLTKNRQADAGIQQNASSQLSNQLGQRSQNSINAIQTGIGSYYNMLGDRHSAAQLSTERAKMFTDLVPLFNNMTSRLKGVEVNNLYGSGSQASSALSAGFNLCCFIFLEAYNGELPIEVRRYRDMAAPESSKRRKGYIRMSRWLVPAMRVNRTARTLTNYLLVRPLTEYGKWYYRRTGAGWLAWPVKQFWFGVWTLTGGNK